MLLAAEADHAVNVAELERVPGVGCDPAQPCGNVLRFYFRVFDREIFHCLNGHRFVRRLPKESVLPLAPLRIDSSLCRYDGCSEPIAGPRTARCAAHAHLWQAGAEGHDPHRLGVTPDRAACLHCKRPLFADQAPNATRHPRCAIEVSNARQRATRAAHAPTRPSRCQGCRARIKQDRGNKIRRWCSSPCRLRHRRA